MAIRGKSRKNAYILVMFCILMLCCYGKRTKRLCNSGDQGECSFLTLKCPPGHVIYNPDVIGDEDATCSPYDIHKCKGMSPDLNVNILNCYWKNTCNIYLPQQTMALKLINETMDCFNQPVMSLWVRGWKCVNETEIHDICSVTFIDASMGTKGIIRSHANLPWNYKKSLFDNGMTPKGQCKTTLGAYLEDSDLYIQMVLSVYSIDIDTTSELVKVNFTFDGQKIQKHLSWGDLHGYFKGDEKTGIGIEFSSNNKYNETKAGSGFVLCYKYLKRGEQIHSGICDEIFKNNLATPLCTVCRYEKIGTWTECSEMKTQLIAKVTSKSNPSCEKTKVIQERYCYCEYQESLTKCNLTTKSYTLTKTLTEQSDIEFCPKKVSTDFYCDCKYREEFTKCNLTTGNYTLTKTLTKDSDAEICPKKVVKEVQCDCNYQESFTKCNLTTKTYTLTKILTKDSDAEFCPTKVVNDFHCECKYGNKTRCLKKKGILVTYLTPDNRKTKNCPKRKRVGTCIKRGHNREACKNKKSKKCRSKKKTGEKRHASRRRKNKRSRKQSKQKSHGRGKQEVRSRDRTHGRNSAFF